MATIVGAVASSHTPTIGFAYDRRKKDDPVWAPIFKGYEPVQQWLAQHRPEVLLYIYNDHVTSFFFDHYSQFALGIGATWPVADEGGGPRALPAIDGHPALARHIAEVLVAGHTHVSIKAKSNEGMGFIGRGEGIAAIAVATLVETRTTRLTGAMSMPE